MKTTRRFFTARAVTPSRSAAAARRTTPGPASTRYGVPFTTTATAGPERSGSALGVPVPSTTTLVSATPLDADNKAAPSTSIRGSIATEMGMTHFIALTNVRLRFAAYLHFCGNDSREKIPFSLPKPSTFPFYEHYGLLRPTVVSIELELTRKRLTECDASYLV